MKALRFDFRDVFRANRLAFSLQRIWIQLVGTFVAYAVYTVLTYISLILSGHSLTNIWAQMGVFPCLFGHDAGLVSWIIFGVAIVFLAITLLITNTAVARAIYMLQKGNYFYTWKEAYRFAIKKAGAVIFAPIAIAFLIGLFLSGGAIIGLLAKIPVVGEIGLTLTYVLWVLAGLLLVLFIIALAVCIIFAPSIIATTDDDAFEAVFQSFSIVWSQPWRVILYELQSIILSGLGILVFAFLVKQAFLIVDNLFAAVIGDKYINIAGQALYFLSAWIGVVSSSVQNLLGNHTGLVWFNHDFLQLDLSTIHQIAAIIFAISLLFFALLIVSYGLATFVTGTTLSYIVIRMKRENDNLLERKDREEEIEDESDETSSESGTPNADEKDNADSDGKDEKKEDADQDRKKAGK